MNLNIASQNQGVVGFAFAAANPAVDIRHHINFGFTFQVTADILVEAVFEITAAPADAVNPCIPGAFHDIAEVPMCDWLTAGALATDSKIAIPVGTKAGSICTATLPCKPDAFVKVNAVSGDTAKVAVVVVLGGPR